jgi:hypothetical protein
MMKNLLTVILVATMVFCFAACSSMESDAKQTAKNAYRSELQWDGKIEMSVQEQKEIVAWGNKMLEKYGKDRKQLEQFNKMVKQETEKIRKKK